MKKYLFILLVLSLFLTSCENEIGFTEQNSSRGSFQITPQEAAQIASCSAISYSTRSKNVEAENVLSISFSEVDSTAQEANQPLMYVVNYKQGGYALVPADKRVSTPILALIDNGQFNDKVKKNFLSQFIAKDIENYIRNEIAVYQDSQNQDYRITYTSIKEYQNVVDTLIKTQWTEGAPFNNYCQVSGTKKRAKAGCAAIATGQIFAYYKYPAKYNGHDYLWNEILSGEKQPTTEKGKTAVAYLISDIGRLDKTIYGVSSSATNVTNVKNALNTMGYNYTYEQNPLSFVIYVNVLRSHPVLISATEENKKIGHIWVIDGYADGIRYKQYEDYNTGEIVKTEKEVLPLVHCNWGWGGQGNGYYLFNVFDMQYKDPHKTRATYNSNISAYVNISPKK